MAGERPNRRLTDGELTIQHAGYHDFITIELMVIELRERRAADLTDAQRELIDWALGVLSSYYNDVPHDEIAALRTQIASGASWHKEKP